MNYTSEQLQTIVNRASALQSSLVLAPMVNVLRCVCCDTEWLADGPEKHVVPCLSGSLRRALDEGDSSVSFDPTKMPPPGTPCAVVDAMARELSSAASSLQEVIPLVSDGNYIPARSCLLDTPALRPARQYLLGLADAREDEPSEATPAWICDTCHHFERSKLTRCSACGAEREPRKDAKG